MKKRLKLKKQPIIFLVVLIILIILIIFGYNRYKLYVYHNSTEYKLLELGYTEAEIKLFEKKLKKDTYNSLAEERKKTHLGNLVKEKYFMEKNLDRYLTYADKNKSKSYTDIVAIVNVNADYEWYEVEIETNIKDDVKMIVNKFYKFAEDYVPDDIEEISNWYAYENNSARKVAIDAYVEMWNAAKEAGFTLIVNSSYRSLQEQQETYDHYDDYYGTEYADGIAARPGHSEHQTGLALDIITPGVSTKEFVNHDAYKWLQDNSYKYGFIIRFPEGKEYLTGYNFESWHYRYLGKDLATKVYNEKITYDEYYAFYLAK